MAYPNLLGIQQDIFNNGQDLNISDNVYFNSLNPSSVLATNGNNELVSTTTNTTTLGYLNNVTSDIQAQINSKTTISGLTTGHHIVATGTSTVGNSAIVTESGGNLIVEGNINPYTNTYTLGTTLLGWFLNAAGITITSALANAFVLSNGTTNLVTMNGNGNMVMACDIVPSVTNTNNLGSSSVRFNNVYGNNVNYVALVNGSDKRLKNNIKDLKTGLEFINDLSPKIYNYKGDTVSRLGLVAQDVQKVLELYPDLKNNSIVHKMDNGMLGLNYVELITPLIAAIQELNAEINLLKVELDALHS